MTNFGVRRCTHLFCRFDNKEFIDLHSILAGEARLGNRDRILAISLLTETEYEIGQAELTILAGIPQREWRCAQEVCQNQQTTEEHVLSLADKGLLITDLPGDPFTEYRNKDRKLEKADWAPHAALHHYMGKWNAEDIPEKSGNSSTGENDVNQSATMPLELKIRSRGQLPPHFHVRKDAVATIDLPIEHNPDPLFQLLTRRCTARHFDSSRALPLAQFSTVLYYTFGCHGLAPMTSNKDYAGLMQAVKRTSPSGGALTPVECYPLVTRVEGLDAGLYHYNMERHALEQLSAMDVGPAESLAEEFTAGQTYYANAHVLFILTARFYRNYWKYGNHKKAYKVVLLDAAHLSQTLYLACTDLGLGAFVTSAIHDAKIDEALGLDKLEEGVILVSGCGISLPALEQRPDFRPVPYDPASARNDR